ncbi:DUF2569 domain-containing protein [Providencia burhodogranariea]|uniref:DUF2569 domain-containing protein n=1 Tax=Providencia burhodogranariea DSM 19968 TaxID=1141662 RepID=K8W9G4_9GAMM|nr:hypothetical protein OOA_15075 [Providencia burhodogranariea DSM 19968]
MNNSEDRSVLGGNHDTPSMKAPNAMPVASNYQPAPKLEGLGGWLILPMLGLIISVFYLPFSFWMTYPDIFEYWDELTDPVSSAFIPLFKELIYFEVLGNVILYGTLLFLCYLFFTKKRLTVRVSIFFYLFSLTLIIADVILAKQLLTLPVESTDIRDILRGVVACIIWIPYFLKSVRVKNTFVN